MPIARPTNDWTPVARQIARHLDAPFNVERADALSGGSINSVWLVSGNGARFFVKLNTSENVEMFQAEFDGLLELARAEAVRVPRPLCAGNDDERAWLVLEHLELRRPSAAGWEQLGAALAAQHRRLGSGFGWVRDNTIGSTPQPNGWCADWFTFLREQRLGFQLRLSAAKGYEVSLRDKGERLLEVLPVFFAGYSPQPSLLHGDLWSGNVGFLDHNEPVIFDPAVYYGDREADLAMTELFGGFGAQFYAVYRESWPLDAGYAVRSRLYNLYHLLNHLNLFGAGYLRDCNAGLDWLLAQC